MPTVRRRRNARQRHAGPRVAADLKQPMFDVRCSPCARRVWTLQQVRVQRPKAPRVAGADGREQTAAIVCTSTRKASLTSRSTMRRVFGGYLPSGNIFGNSRNRNSTNFGMGFTQRVPGVNPEIQSSRRTSPLVRIPDSSRTPREVRKVPTTAIQGGPGGVSFCIGGRGKRA